MFPHPLDEIRPKLLAAFLVDAFVANDRELLRPRRDENQDAVPFPRFLHPKLQKFLLSSLKCVLLKFSPLEKDANLAGSFRFRVFNRFYDPIVLQLANESMGPH